jgi:hypothetical protein
MLLTQFTPPGNRIYLLKPGIANNSDEIYDIALIQSQLPSGLKDCLLFLHAMTGCDTTSALYGQGKKKAFNLLKKNIESRECAQIFNSDTSTASMIVTAGERFLLTLYGAPRTTTSLNEHRYHSFTKAVAKSPVHTELRLASLPPTLRAAEQRSKRVYLQVQQWHGRELPPTEWGWTLKNSLLVPVRTKASPAPDNIMNLISCNCKTGCGSTCGCRKAGVKCSILCGHCRGSACTNCQELDLDGSDDEDEVTINVPECTKSREQDMDDTADQYEDSLNDSREAENEEQDMDVTVAGDVT